MKIKLIKSLLSNCLALKNKTKWLKINYKNNNKIDINTRTQYHLQIHIDFY